MILQPGVRAAILLLFLHGGAYAGMQTSPALDRNPASAPAESALPVAMRDAVARLYAAHPAPLWLADNQAPARLALQLLHQAADHGLDPRRYDVDALAQRLAGLHDDTQAARFEHDLSAAMLHYLADVHAGRSGPAERQPADAGAQFDVVEHLRAALSGGRLAQTVDAAAPAIPLYGRVKTMLAQYRQLARVAPPWAALPAAPRAGVHAGDAYAGAASLGDRLRLLGDLDPDTVTEGDRMTPALAAALRRFQARHGLEEDGVLGAGTAAALAVPPAHRAAQLALTLERLRWLPPPPPHGRVVAVNVPTYHLWAFDATDRFATPALEMRVIVGAAGKTSTPLFIGQMRYLEFAPYWNVPRSIQTGEIMPKLARNPAYLQQNDMELVGADGHVLLAAPGQALALLRSGGARVRQRPGPQNVLGAVKFAMPNPMNIYLHSTAAKALFQRSRRDLSHGCIRVEHPADLARFVLADPQHWDDASVAAAMLAGQNRTVKLAEPVPVVLFYATALVDRAGRALFADDIYRRDQPLIDALHLE
jgi:murein L,D-transpeptidase YcbB/YkuD